MTDISRLFEIDMQTLLGGELNRNALLNGNMKKMKFYVCPDCGNLMTSMSDLSVSCCGRQRHALTPQKATAEEMLKIQIVDNDYVISSEHEMIKTHYITFVALVTSDTVMVKKLYPEWDLQVHIPVFAHGRLLWYCNQHGLFYQDI